MKTIQATIVTSHSSLIDGPDLVITPSRTTVALPSHYHHARPPIIVATPTIGNPTSPRADSPFTNYLDSITVPPLAIAESLSWTLCMTSDQHCQIPLSTHRQPRSGHHTSRHHRVWLSMTAITPPPSQSPMLATHYLHFQLILSKLSVLEPPWVWREC